MNVSTHLLAIELCHRKASEAYRNGQWEAAQRFLAAIEVSVDGARRAVEGERMRRDALEEHGK